MEFFFVKTCFFCVVIDFCRDYMSLSMQEMKNTPNQFGWWKNCGSTILFQLGSIFIEWRWNIPIWVSLTITCFTPIWIEIPKKLANGVLIWHKPVWSNAIPCFVLKIPQWFAKTCNTLQTFQIGNNNHFLYTYTAFVNGVNV